jgi:hypothetical protein
MRHFAKTLPFWTMLLVGPGCGSGDDGDTSLSVAWSFASGDCASLGVETVRVTWGPRGGATEIVEFACDDGSGRLGNVAEGGGSYSIDAEGLDADGMAVVESYGVSTTFSGGAPGGHTVDFTLHPKGADVVVSWSLAGGGSCPSGVILPYFITIYEAPAAGGDLTDEVAETQESCSLGEATLTNVPPGEYVVEVDSRAVTPAVSGTAPLTVEAGQDAQVSVDL